MSLYTSTKFYYVLIIVTVHSPEPQSTSPCVCNALPFSPQANHLAQLHDPARQRDQSAGHIVIKNPSHPYLRVFQYRV